MLKWIKQAVSLLPSHYGNILLYNTLTGLRSSEAMESLRLIRADPDYFNKDLMVLEHFRHPKIFLRRTKKAYITLVIPEILSLAKRCELEDSWNGLYCALKRRGLGSHTKYCRAIFATYLRKRGMESEIIDIFQGRVPKTVFAKYYFRPDFEDSCTRMKAQLRRLHREIAVT
jgi:intergrase/recombinase